MKSLHNPLIHGNTQHRATAWQPQEFSTSVPKNSGMSVEQVLDLFLSNKNQSVRQNKLGSDRQRSLFSEAETSDVQSWNPGEIQFSSLKPLPGNDVQPKSAQSVRWQDFNRNEAHPSQAHGQHGQSVQSEEGGHAVNPIKKAEEAALRIMEEAREEARLIVEQAQSQAQDILLQNQVQASEAFEEARKMAYQEFEEENQMVQQALKTILEQVSAWKEETLQQSTPLIIDVIRDITNNLFGSGLVLDTEKLQHNLNRIMDNAKNLGNLKIYLHPVDAGHLDPYWREFTATMTGSLVQIIPTEGVTPGGCFIHGDTGNVDARIETQLRAVMETLHSAESNEESF
ncbi:MAG: hypothetical protein CVU39_09370 [Chloroflexi bacterium HGW-Chloroflexi-10]|nr:MAG: hypothetical protein CVU39_09370 [Chloroflexi bacterium HGW-Chloroflexi-10]